MQIQYDHLVCVAKEAQLFVGHLDRSMVYIGHVLDRVLQLAGVELNLRVGHVDRLEGVRLRSQRFLLVLEIIDAIGQV